MLPTFSCSGARLSKVENIVHKHRYCALMCICAYHGVVAGFPKNG
jgi:hypothetical protein